MAMDERSLPSIKRPDWVGPFLQALAIKGIVGQAARSAGISRRAAYLYRERDTEFALMWDDAIEEATDRLEEEIRRRGEEGVEEPVFGRVARDQDGEIGTVRKYSDTLLIFLTKGMRPEKYRERHEVHSTGKVQVEYVNDWRDPEASEQ